MDRKLKEKDQSVSFYKNNDGNISLKKKQWSLYLRHEFFIKHYSAS